MAGNTHSSKSIMVVTIVIAVVLIALIVPLSLKGKGAAGSGADEAVEVRIAPVAQLTIAGHEAATSGPRDGASIYKNVCSACHASGALGSPKAGDKAAWAPRLAQGKAALYTSALKGKNSMPARGGAADLSDDEVKSAVDYLTGLAK
ncbi:cytochrome c5 family protein [Rhodocyclus tenuis]|uniref:Cytochrome c5 family protein n=2 Tax=Rhodocyclus TaxID=1064 RepID=A0A6L5JYJ3_RHOTE|nr:c-type cytochrome [Rhodocyclus gracilis]MQY52393.1 cytochrome c5 family protein [Rhodocyclus gracilis]NJA88297.1 cytochrome c5 family protein [Rhodocyclus gracilis]